MNRPLAAGLLATTLALGLAVLPGGIPGARAEANDPNAPIPLTPDAAQRQPDRKTYLPPGHEPQQPAPGQQPYPRQTYPQQPYPQQPYPRQPDAREPYPPAQTERRDTYSDEEILSAGHRFFGRVSVGLARVIEYAFQKAGRPNGYILGEEAGGAFVAGLRYGEGMLYTKNAGEHKVFWQGPSIGYDFGAEGSKTMILVYNLQRVEDIYNTFGGVDGSAYFIGGVGITFQTHRHMTLAPIRAGIGLRLGANVGYLKYTRRPTWNPF